MAPHADAAALQKIDPATVLSHELLVHILKNLTKHPAKHPAAMDPAATLKFPGIACLSSSYRDAIGEITNDTAMDIQIDAATLKSIKATARGLDLKFTEAAFFKTALRDLGEFDLMDYGVDEEEFDDFDEEHIGAVIRAIMMAFKARYDAASDDKTAIAAIYKATVSAYRKFMVVKTVETLIKKRIDATGVLQSATFETKWLEKSMASPLIDVIWHLHMLNPQHYLTSCSALLGYTGVIDHDAGYISPHKVTGSDLIAKMSKLYNRERSYHPDLSYHSGTALSVSSTSGHDEQSAVLTHSKEGWVEIAFEDRMYGDDMECG